MLGTIIVIIYWIAGYWAVGQTVYADKIRVGTWSDLFLTQAIIGLIGGFVLIPVAIVKKIIESKSE